MSHQDRTSDIVINHETIKQAVDWLLPPLLFGRMKVRKGATWSARMSAVAALLWATSDRPTLKSRFEHARKIVKKVFRWMPAPGATYQGFMKVLRKWHVELMLVITPHVQAQMKEVLPGQWEIAGYVIFAGDGSRVELARTEALERVYSPKRSRKAKGKQRKQKRGRGSKCSAKRRTAKKKKQSEESLKKKANSPHGHRTKPTERLLRRTCQSKR